MNPFYPSGLTPAGIPYLGTAQIASVATVSSRLINPDGSFSLDINGAFTGMNDTMQRAFIKLALGVKIPDKIGNDYAMRMESDVRTALKSMTDEKSLEIKSVEVVDGGKSATYVRVRLVDLLSGQESTVSLP